MAILLLLMFY